MNPVAIGIDVGGTKIAGALIEVDGTAIGERVVPTPRNGEGADPGAEATTDLVRQLLAEADAAGRDVVAAGLGVPEYVTPDGRIASSEVLAWRRDDLDALRAQLELIIESDVRCAARAERVVGDGSRYDSFLYVSIGTGISHTLSIGDRLVTGHRGEAIALGEVPVCSDMAIRSDSPLTVESQASGRAIAEHSSSARRADQAPPSTDDGLESNDGAGRDDIAAAIDDVAARAGRIVAEAIATVVGLVDPQVIILGGGLGSSSGPYTDSLIEEATRLLARRPGGPAVLRSGLGNRGGVIGAGLTVHQVGR